MKRIALLATLVVLAVLTMPAHTKEPAEKISVIIANDPGNPVPIDGSVIVTNTPEVSVTNVPDVNVANIPTIEVGNTAANPVMVQSVSEESQQVLQVRVSGNIADGVPTVVEPIDVPNGKWFIIEYVSARIYLPEGENQKAHLNLGLIDPVKLDHFLPLNLQGVFPTSMGLMEAHLASQQIKMYAQPHSTGGNDMVILVERYPTVEAGAYVVSLSGQLVDIP